MLCCVCNAYTMDCTILCGMCCSFAIADQHGFGNSRTALKCTSRVKRARAKNKIASITNQIKSGYCLSARCARERDAMEKSMQT